MMAQATGLKPGEFVHTFGDAHLYLNHLDQAKRQLAREPLPVPDRCSLAPKTDLFAFEYEDIALEGYQRAPGHQGADRGLSRPPAKSLERVGRPPSGLVGQAATSAAAMSAAQA